MTVRRVRRVPGGGGSPNTSSKRNNANPSSSRPERSGAIMARGDNTNNSDDDCWSAGESTTSYSKQAHLKNKPGMSLSEKLRQQELYEQQQQQRHQVNNQRGGRGPVMDTDHTATLEQQQATTARGSSNAQKSSAGRGPVMDTDHEISVDGSAWSSWGSNSRGNSIRSKSSDGMRRMPIGGSGKQGKFKALFHQAARYKMNLVGDTDGSGSKLKERMLSVVNNCTKSAPSPRNSHSQQQQQQRGYNAHGDSSNGSSGMMKIIGFLLFILLSRAVFHLGKHRGMIGSSKSSSRMSNMNDPYNHLRGQTQNNLDISNNIVIHQATFPTHLSHLSNLTSTYNPQLETPYFWDVHFSGESVAEYIFGHCHGLIQASEFGMRQPGYNEDKLEVFELDKTKYVNVDTTTQEGIQRASRLGLASTHTPNMVIISPHFTSVTSQIFSPTAPGRMFAIFRHPVDRALGMYYYLQKASWDPHYNPSLGQMSIQEYAKSKYIENNWLTRFLVNKPRGKLTHGDMLMAKKIIKFKVLVGLYDDMEVSMARFQRYFGWNRYDSMQQKADVVKCRSEAVLRGDVNVLGHPISIKEAQEQQEDASFSGMLYGMMTPSDPNSVRSGSIAWNAIVKMNLFDMELYEFVKKIYTVQGEKIFDVVGGQYINEVSAPGAGASGGSSSSLGVDDTAEDNAGMYNGAAASGGGGDGAPQPANSMSADTGQYDGAAAGTSENAAVGVGADGAPKSPHQSSENSMPVDTGVAAAVGAGVDDAPKSDKILTDDTALSPEPIGKSMEVDPKEERGKVMTMDSGIDNGTPSDLGKSMALDSAVVGSGEESGKAMPMDSSSESGKVMSMDSAIKKGEEEDALVERMKNLLEADSPKKMPAPESGTRDMAMDLANTNDNDNDALVSSAQAMQLDLGADSNKSSSGKTMSMEEASASELNSFPAKSSSGKIMSMDEASSELNSLPMPGGGLTADKQLSDPKPWPTSDVLAGVVPIDTYVHSGRETPASTNYGRVLLYITTHFSAQHQLYMDYCWQHMLARSPLLQSADVAVLLNPNDDKRRGKAMNALKDIFVDHNLKVYIRSYPKLDSALRSRAKKQTGAVMAMHEAVTEGYFDGYDWVIRLNPDVLIRDDSFLRESMTDPSLSALLINCKNSVNKQIQTDFFIVRPMYMQAESFPKEIHKNAEVSFTDSIQHSILDKNTFKWIPGADPLHRRDCRAGEGKDFYESPIIHEHYIHPDICPFTDADVPVLNSVFPDGWPQNWKPWHAKTMEHPNALKNRGG